MDFRGLSGQMHHTHPYRTPSAPSSSNYTNLYEGDLLTGRRLVGQPEILLRDLEKQRIREKILLAEEAERKRCAFEEYMLQQDLRGLQSGGGFPSSSSPLILGHPDSHLHYRFQSRMLHGQSYEQVDRRVAMPFLEEYGGSGRQPSELVRRSLTPFQDYGGSARQPGEVVGVDVVPIQRGPKITSVPKTGSKAIIGMGNPISPTVKGAKRKPQSPAGRDSTEILSGSKKKMKDWSCAICKVSATSERGLQDHLAGKKHQAKEAELKAEHTGKIDNSEIKNSPESVQIDECEDKKPEGEGSKQKFKFWCRMCKIGASNKKEMNMHKKGIRHLKNQLKLAQKSRGKTSGESKRV